MPGDRAVATLAAGFRVLLGNRKSQAVQMTIQPGDHEGGPDNRHVGADQWLFVVEGSGVALLDGKRRRLSPHVLLLIEAGRTHEIRNTGDVPLRTLNVYVPPAYTADGDPLPRGRKR